jgi:hypothetical protein
MENKGFKSQWGYIDAGVSLGTLQNQCGISIKNGIAIHRANGTQAEFLVRGVLHWKARIQFRP